MKAVIPAEMFGKWIRDLFIIYIYIYICVYVLVCCCTVYIYVQMPNMQFQITGNALHNS